MTHQGECDFDEVVARTSLIEQRAKLHEQENQFGGDTERDAEDAFRGEPLVVRDGTEAGPFPCEKARSGRSEEGVSQEHDGDDHKGRTKGTPGRLE